MKKWIYQGNGGNRLEFPFYVTFVVENGFTCSICFFVEVAIHIIYLLRWSLLKWYDLCYVLTFHKFVFNRARTHYLPLLIWELVSCMDALECFWSSEKDTDDKGKNFIRNSFTESVCYQLSFDNMLVFFNQESVWGFSKVVLKAYDERFHTWSVQAFFHRILVFKRKRFIFS